MAALDISYLISIRNLIATTLVAQPLQVECDPTAAINTPCRCVLIDDQHITREGATLAEQHDAPASNGTRLRDRETHPFSVQRLLNLWLPLALPARYVVSYPGTGALRRRTRLLALRASL